MEEDIKMLEVFIRSIRSDLEDESPDNWKLAKAIENLLKRYKELEEENKHLKDFIDEEEERIAELSSKNCELELIIEQDYIPISVIHNKIDELEREFNFYAGREHFEWQDGEFDGEVCDDISLKIGILKKLLKKESL